MNELIFSLAMVVYLFLMNIIWFIICLIIWPFKQEFIYDWRYTTQYLITLHSNEARRRKGLEPRKMPKRKYRPKGRPVSQMTFKLVYFNWEWSSFVYRGYLRGALLRANGQSQESLEYMIPIWFKEDREQKAAYDKINDYYQLRSEQIKPS